ncbi:MAG: putative molybdenum carrier protein [Thermodesulfobacteriota bacterium]
MSGGQTGVDQAALDAAIEMGLPHGRWIPKGRLTEAGPLPNEYNLQEMPNKDYLKRTKQNVLDSDGTVVFSHGDLKGGSKRTGDFATELCKPFLHVDLNKTGSAECIGKPLPKAWKQRSSYGFCRSMDATKSRTTCSAGHCRQRRSRVFWRKVVYRPET